MNIENDTKRQCFSYFCQLNHISNTYKYMLFFGHLQVHAFSSNKNMLPSNASPDSWVLSLVSSSVPNNFIGVLHSSNKIGAYPLKNAYRKWEFKIDIFAIFKSLLSVFIVYKYTNIQVLSEKKIERSVQTWKINLKK